MLPIIVQHLPRDRERMSLRPVQMAGRLSLTLSEYRAPEYRAVEAGELNITNDLSSGWWSYAGGLDSRPVARRRSSKAQFGTEGFEYRQGVSGRRSIHEDADIVRG